MKAVNFRYENTCCVDSDTLAQLQKKMLVEIERICGARMSGYSTDYASINLSFDVDLLKIVKAVADEKKLFNPTILLVIGIGGSNLGTIAVLEALRGKFYNVHSGIATYFLDTVDTDYMVDIIHLVERELTVGNSIIINVISKSGTTVETIANFGIFLELLKKYRPHNYYDLIVIITDEDSVLWKLGQKERFACIAVPEKVGGRYSVFSAVGLFPLYFLGIDIEELCRGAQSGFFIGTSKKLKDNYALLSAVLIATHYERGNIIHDTFIFSSELQSFGAWYRQLSAESIGKAYNRCGELVNIGVLPTISMGSTDLHSVAQLYLAGPHNRFTTFVSVNENESNVTIPTCQELEAIVPYIQSKSLSSVMNAILKGMQKAYCKGGHPFVVYALPKKSAYYLGQIMQIKMIEIMYLGFFLNVNPFDQPQVEDYKKETRHILATPIE